MIKVVSHKISNGISPLENVKNVLLVGSGKGGVGKSTTAVNLALSLHRLGLKVGLLDADIYGPNQPNLLNVCRKPELLDEKTFVPVEQYGLQTMSMGYLVDKATPMVWRGPMISQATLQMLQNTKWSDLDFLIVDLPPGTGDVQLTLSQKAPVTAAVIVTTPQDLALLDARKAIAMFQKVNIPILGVIENMSTHICSHCGHEEALFGEKGGDQLAAENKAPLLGRVPLNISVRKASDSGLPIVLDADHPVTQVYVDIALALLTNLAKYPKNYANKFGKIAVEN